MYLLLFQMLFHTDMMKAGDYDDFSVSRVEYSID